MAEPSQNRPEDTPKHSKYHWGVWVAVILILAVPLPVLRLLFQQKKPARQMPPVAISTTNVMVGNIDQVEWGLGTVTPIYTAMVSPRVDGQLVSVHYTEGQNVTTNDLLVEIDPSPYKAMVEQAEGQLARDKALLEGALVDLARYKDAYAKKAIPEQQVADETALVHQDEGLVKYDQGQLDTAKVQLAYCYIYAPFAGRTGLRLVDPGNVVHAANTNPVVVVTQTQPITVVFSLPEKILPDIQKQLRAGRKLTVETWNYGQTEKLATGTFLTMDNLIDTTTGTIRIKAIFDNDDMALYPNQFVNPKLIIDTLSNVTLVPTPDIQRNPQGAFVYVVSHQTVTITNASGAVVTTNQATVHMQDVTTGVSDPDLTEIHGVEAGELIASDNFNKLGDGARVILRSPGAGGRKRGGGPGGEKRHRADKEKGQEEAP